MKEKVVFPCTRDLIFTFNDKVSSDLYEEKPKKKSKKTHTTKQKKETCPYQLFYDKIIDQKDIEKLETKSVYQELS